MRILFLIERLASGGAERQLTNLMNGLEALGHQIFLITWVPNDHYCQDDIPNIKWIKYYRRSKFDFSIIGKIKKLIKAEDIQVVQGFLDTGNLYGFLATYSFKSVIFFASERNSNRNWKGLSWFHKRIVHLYAHCTICNSIAGLNFVRALCGHNVNAQVIRNGFDIRKFAFIDKKERNYLRKTREIPIDSLIYISVARITPTKRQKEIVIEFCKLFSNSNTYLFLVGHHESKYVQQIRSEIARFNMESQVLIFEPQKDIVELYKIADIFVLNSIFEGSPNTVVEAMLCGLPVIVTNCGDVKYYLDSTTGNGLIQPENAGLLSEEMLRLSKLYSEDRFFIGISNRNRLINILNISVENMVAEYHYVYTNARAR